jgi:hypothetical protein
VSDDIELHGLRFVPDAGRVWLELTLLQEGRELFVFTDAGPALSQLAREMEAAAGGVGETPCQSSTGERPEQNSTKSKRT